MSDEDGGFELPPEEAKYSQNWALCAQIYETNVGSKSLEKNNFNSLQ